MTELSAGVLTASDDREAILVAFAELVSRQDYKTLSADEVVARAGIAPVVFAEHFDTLDECAVAAFDFAAARVFSVVAQRFMATSGDYTQAGVAALRALLEYVAQVPAFTYMATVGVPSAPALDRHRHSAMAQFAEFLKPGFLMRGRQPAPQDHLIAQMIGGGVMEIFRGYALENRIADLPEALPALTYCIFSLLFDTDAAERAVAEL